MIKIEIHADGSVYPNNGSGTTGGGIVIICNGDATAYSRHFGVGTNNTAELNAIKFGLERVLVALEKITDWKSRYCIELYSDSEYSLNMLNGTWALTKNKKNFELITSIKEVLTNFKDISLIHERGHSDNEMNNWCDELATDGRLLKEARYEKKLT